MDMLKIMESRHSVRKFIDKPLEESAVKALKDEIAERNAQSGLSMQLITNEPEAFQAEKPSYGQFKGCRNYISVVGPKGKKEEAGYYGECVVLKAQELGINSCWVALTYKKGKTHDIINPGEKRHLVIALGYGETQGSAHKIKDITSISDFKEGDPDWYENGLRAALLAPTAMNQQKFRFTRDQDKVKAKVAGFGFYAKTDLGIAKLHFELGSGKGRDVWS